MTQCEHAQILPFRATNSLHDSTHHRRQLSTVFYTTEDSICQLCQREETLSTSTAEEFRLWFYMGRTQAALEAMNVCAYLPHELVLPVSSEDQDFPCNTADDCLSQTGCFLSNYNDLEDGCKEMSWIQVMPPSNYCMHVRSCDLLEQCFIWTLQQLPPLKTDPSGFTRTGLPSVSCFGFLKMARGKF